MKSWSLPNLNKGKSISGRLLIPDTVGGKTYEPITDSKLKLYVCGITPYDSAHVGHLFTYLIFDVLNRSARKLGAEVVYVQNVTDIDDPLFERARKVNRGWRDIADEQIGNFQTAMEYLRVIPPTYFSAVTEEIENIVQSSIAMDAKLYQLEGTTYFVSDLYELQKFTNLSELELLAIAAERGGDPDRIGKRNKLDPKVWVQSADDEPTWNSPFGPGRPGWHIECVAIANRYLENTFDVQGGGKDLLFPHHAFCNQMNLAINNEPLARGFLHVELVEYEGDKMSKSLGNLVFLKDLIDAGFSADEIRLGLLLKDWQAPWEFNMQTMFKGREELVLWRGLIDREYFVALDDLIELASNTLFNGLAIEKFISGIASLPIKSLPRHDISESLDFLNDLLGLDLQVKSHSHD